MSKDEREVVLRRIVVEYGRNYAYAYMTDANARVMDEEVFKQPFALAQREVAEEAKDCWDNTYQWLQDTVLWYATARDEPKEEQSEEPPEKD